MEVNENINDIFFNKLEIKKKVIERSRYFTHLLLSSWDRNITLNYIQNFYFSLLKPHESSQIVCAEMCVRPDEVENLG